MPAGYWATRARVPLEYPWVYPFLSIILTEGTQHLNRYSMFRNWHASVLARSSTVEDDTAVPIALDRFGMFYGLSTMRTTTLPSAL